MPATSGSPIALHRVCARLETCRHMLLCCQSISLRPRQSSPTVHRNRLWESTTLHDAEELVLVHLTIAITIGLVDHLLELLVGHVLTELLSDALQVLEGDLASLVVVEETEHLHDLLTGVAVAHASSHHVEELVEIDGAGTVLVDVVDHAANLVFLRVEAEGTHGDL